MAASSPLRSACLTLHRIMGLALGLFLIVIAATGSAIAFYKEMERALNAHMRMVEPQPQGWTLQDALKIRARLEAQDPHSSVFSLQLPQNPDEALFARVMPAIDPKSGREYALDYDELFANPYNGERLGRRRIGAATFHLEGLPSFLYYLHYALFLPFGAGILLIGILGLVWLVESMTGFWLTLPAQPKKSKKDASPRPFHQRWASAWKIERKGNTNRLLFDLHRAPGLWLWPLLAIFAITGFALNLGGPYAHAVQRIAAYEHFQEAPPRETLPQPLINPPINWFKAAELGQRYFAQQAQREGFTLGKPAAIEYRRDLGLYFFLMHTSRDLLDAQGRPTETDSPATAATIAIDARDGRFVGLQLPTGQRAGNTLTSWLIALHVTAVGGRVWQVVVACFGLAVVLGCVTGLWLWWRRRVLR
ncbi:MULTISPECIES: PepSY-associated TM helix domain-containing protein [unclassified Novosphingobium]|uniref:PepSY-associated TM helix domain-containing protein n=1 Tax=unclassified Novosphingobium TaxID=2644732 RepID=UPI0026011ABE|nr:MULTISPECIES: PepSY-associated TM helix domain-containing protein [unclassified Novosphingobium]MDR6707554.1 putative iron-regulated membrane protein [Novosphingobium sp. 1748]